MEHKATKATAYTTTWYTAAEHIAQETEKDGDKLTNLDTGSLQSKNPFILPIVQL